MVQLARTTDLNSRRAYARSQPCCRTKNTSSQHGANETWGGSPRGERITTERGGKAATEADPECRKKKETEPLFTSFLHNQLQQNRPLCICTTDCERSRGVSAVGGYVQVPLDQSPPLTPFTATSTAGMKDMSGLSRPRPWPRPGGAGRPPWAPWPPPPRGAG